MAFSMLTIYWHLSMVFSNIHIQQWNHLLLLLLLLSCFSHVRLCVTPQMAAHQARPSLGFSRQEHWSGLPFPSPMHKTTIQFRAFCPPQRNSVLILSQYPISLFCPSALNHHQFTFYLCKFVYHGHFICMESDSICFLCLSLSIMFLRFIHILACISISFIFIAK